MARKKKENIEDPVEVQKVKKLSAEQTHEIQPEETEDVAQDKLVEQTLEEIAQEEPKSEVPEVDEFPEGLPNEPAPAEILEDPLVEVSVEQEAEEQKQDDEVIRIPVSPKTSSSKLYHLEDKGFQASIDGWWTTENDTKKRYAYGVFSNNQIKPMGTLRVLENGILEYVKHIDWAKRQERFGINSEEFIVKKMSEKNGVLEIRKVIFEF